MVNRGDISEDKTIGELGREALWFLTHTLVAIVLLAITVGVMSLNHPDPDSPTPKLLGTILALLVPMIGSFLLARIHHNDVAAYIGISGLERYQLWCNV
jgi:hypothetical protein